MKSPWRTAIALSAIVVLLVALGWGCGILYWHVRIRRAIREFEEATRGRQEVSLDGKAASAWLVLTNGGCRSLPYFVESLDDSKNPLFLSYLTLMFTGFTMLPDYPMVDSIGVSDLVEKADVFTITLADSPSVRREKIEKLREWWRVHGAAHHQFWRFWSDRCKPFDRDDP
jgi:hypothetical protein